MNFVLIAGPTASGKSRLALEIARQRGGIIVNADSLQVYCELRILTARPSLDDESAVPHHLYGHVPAATRYSVGQWLGDVAGIIAEARETGVTVVVVGGTGLYFKALIEGLVTTPPLPQEVRERVLREAEGRSAADLHAELAMVDPEDAAAVRPTDRARIIRALEVFEATGRSLVGWRQRPATPVVDPAETERMVLEVDRAELHRRIAARAERMIGEGALEETQAFGTLGLAADVSAMKAIGLRELLDHLAGRSSLEEALAGLKTETRRYAKRQETWFRNQMADWPRIPG